MTVFRVNEIQNNDSETPTIKHKSCAAICDNDRTPQSNGPEVACSAAGEDEFTQPRDRLEKVGKFENIARTFW